VKEPTLDRLRRQRAIFANRATTDELGNAA